MFKTLRRSTVATAVVIGSLATPVASARFNLEPTNGPGPAAPTHAAPPAAPSPQPSAASAFQWDDAAIGVGGMFALCGAAGATALLARRRRHHPAA